MGGGAAEAVEEQTEFNVVLEDVGAEKIKVIKAVRELNPALGLREAKEVVEGAPSDILEARQQGRRRGSQEDARRRRREGVAQVAQVAHCTLLGAQSANSRHMRQAAARLVEIAGQLGPRALLAVCPLN